MGESTGSHKTAAPRTCCDLCTIAQAVSNVGRLAWKALLSTPMMQVRNGKNKTQAQQAICCQFVVGKIVSNFGPLGMRDESFTHPMAVQAGSHKIAEHLSP